MPGVVEDVTDIILNLKSLAIRLHEDGPRSLNLDIKTKGLVTADAFEDDAQLEILNADAPIATLADGGRLRLEATVTKGRGYVPADRNFDPEAPIGTIPLDSAHSPVRRVNYHVEAARVGQATDYDKLVLEVWTNGTITRARRRGRSRRPPSRPPRVFVNVGTDDAARGRRRRDAAEQARRCSTRTSRGSSSPCASANCLKNAGHPRAARARQKTEEGHARDENFRRKSLNEIKDILREKGLAFGA